VKNKSILAVITVFAAIVAIGCGTGESPTSMATSDPAGKITFSASELVGDQGGKLKTEFNGISAILTVPAGALETEVLITMTLSGNMLSELEVEFGPEGQEFEIAASLELVLPNELVDMSTEEITAIRVSDDGADQEIVDSSVVERGSKTSVTISVPGFSRYSLGDGT